MDQAVTAAPEAAREETAMLLRFTVEQVGTMLDAGVFGSTASGTELREGLLHQMSPQAAPHMMAKTFVFVAILDILRSTGSSLRVDSEGSVRVDGHNLPMPDIIVWEPPQVQDFVPVERVRLLAEVCNTTHADDLGTKSGLYARGGVPEYWVVDLPGRVFHQRWAPANGTYQQERKTPFGNRVVSTTLPGMIIATAPLLDIKLA